MTQTLAKTIYQVFTKTHGLSIQTEALKYLVQTLNELEVRDSELCGILENIVSAYTANEGFYTEYR
jgi:hypothetical protein